MLTPIQRKIGEDDTGHKYATSHRCFGEPCKDENLLIDKYDEPMTELGFPWEINRFFERNADEADKHAQRYSDVADGTYKSHDERVEAEKKAAEAEQKAFNRKKFRAPKDIMEDDWTGHKYVTSHRCFGAPCKEPENVQLEYKTGKFEAERDAEMGYPAKWTVLEYPSEEK